SLSELELKKILLDKMQKSDSFLDHDTHLDLYNALMNSIGLGEAIEKGEIDPTIVLKQKYGDYEDQDHLMCCSKARISRISLDGYGILDVRTFSNIND
nr:hypothetical protein [Tanacetum cinerariifolium]